MMKQFAEIKIYELGGGVAFEEKSASIPFLVLPKGQSTIKSWGTSGFLFENIVTGDVIAFVAEYDDVLDATSTPYGVDQLAVFAALGSFFFELGGGGADNLATVLSNGNQSGPEDIIFDKFFGLAFDNNSRLREGTIDAGLGGQKGIAQICGAGYELKWEAGRLYVMGSSGNTIRWSLYNFNVTPTVTDDDTKGYAVGSYWSLDNGDVYFCSDASTGAAVWTLQDPTSGFVPYTGANNDLNLGTYNLTADHIALNVSPSGAGYVVGATEWNNTIGSSQTLLKGGSVSLKNGVDLVARVVNKVTPNTTLTKAAYQVVKVSGAQGGRLAIGLAQADTDNNSADTLGVVIETIATNQEGFIITVGQIEDINTTGSLQGETWADGDVLYLSPTVAGRITNIKPTGATGHIVVIGYVEYAHANNGKIYVKVMNGWELDELHNVYINTGTLANNDALIYESSTQLWKNKTIATALGFTPVTNARTLTINGTTQDLSANRTFTVADPTGWTYIVKSANQDVTNNATPQDDTELQFSVVAGGHYMVILDLVISANNTTSAYLGRFQISSGTMKGHGIATIPNATGTANIFSQNANAVAQTVGFISGAPVGDLDQLLSGTIIFSFTASANAIFKYQFSGQVAGAGRISRTWKGSILKYKRID